MAYFKQITVEMQSYILPTFFRDVQKGIAERFSKDLMRYALLTFSHLKITVFISVATGNAPGISCSRSGAFLVLVFIDVF